MMKIQTYEKVALFRGLFTGLDHIYGTYDPDSGRCWQVKAPVTDQVIHNHLFGHHPYGVYLLMKDCTQSVVADFDFNNLGPVLEFRARAYHYGLVSYIERSKSKGFHVWIFFSSPGVKARQARLVIREILKEIDQSEIEIFPKQDLLTSEHQYGSFINAPLFGPLVSKGKTVFLCPNKLKPYEDQWEFLRTIQKNIPQTLYDVIEINEWGITQSVSKESYRKIPGWGLPPCARKMLEQGVTANQRVACFRLAVQLKKVGIPQDITCKALEAWSRKNHPLTGKRIITTHEIQQQVDWAYRKTYRSCGCDDPAVAPYCDPENCTVKIDSNSRIRKKESENRDYQRLDKIQ